MFVMIFVCFVHHCLVQLAGAPCKWKYLLNGNTCCMYMSINIFNYMTCQDLVCLLPKKFKFV